jgi:transcriptional regulator with XRE-family HTH domain
MKQDLAFGQRLKSLLEERGVSQAELCDALGLSHGAVHHYLKGRVPRGYTLARIADYLRTTADGLLGLQGRSEAEQLVLWPLKAAQESVLRISKAVNQQDTTSGYLQRFRAFLMKEFTDAVAQIPQADLKAGKLKVQVEHKAGAAPKGFPSLVALVAPDGLQSASALVRFLSQIEEREVLFACVEPKWGNEEFFNQLISTSAYSLCHAACQLLVSKYDADANAELQALLDKLNTDDIVTAHEDFIHEQDRLRTFYPEFYEFVSRILCSELARRFKLDYRPRRRIKKPAK